MMICPKCGKEAGESNFCPECGTKLSDTDQIEAISIDESEKDSNEKTNADEKYFKPKNFNRVIDFIKNKKLIILISFIIFLVLIVVIVIVNEKNNSNNDEISSGNNDYYSESDINDDYYNYDNDDNNNASDIDSQIAQALYDAVKKRYQNSTYFNVDAQSSQYSVSRINYNESGWEAFGRVMLYDKYGNYIDTVNFEAHSLLGVVYAIIK